MNINSAFPSKFLKAADLPEDQAVLVTIDHVTVEDPTGQNDPEEHKPVVYFQGKQKGLVLNKTNSNTLAAIHGPETDDWHGKQVLIYATETEYQGKRVACIRIKKAKGAAAPSPAAPAPAQERQAAEEPTRTWKPKAAPAQQEQSDEIPF